MAEPPEYARMGIDSGAGRSAIDASPRDPGPDRAWLDALLAAEARAATRLNAEELFGRGLLRLRLFLCFRLCF